MYEQTILDTTHNRAQSRTTPHLNRDYAACCFSLRDPRPAIEAMVSFGTVK